MQSVMRFGGVRILFPLHFVVFKKTACHLSAEANVEQVFLRVGQLWEINCAKEEKIPILGIYIDGAGYSDKPDEMYGILCKEWTWDNVKDFIYSL